MNATHTAQAQVTPLPMQGFVSAGGRLRVDANNAALLLELERRRDVKVIELELKQAQLRQVPQAWEALSRWVVGGGVVLLHGDAAQLFGFRTVAARERTRERAGQLFGRARASLPFGANPLLWGGISQTVEGRGRGAMGVYLVYYQLRSGDQLALGHGAGVPLLSVTDLTAATDNKANELPLYAAMVAPYGNGWAMMVPRTIEARADGATFGRNLDAFLAALPSSTTSNEAWTSVSASAIETAHRQVLNGKAVEWNKLSLAFGEALQPLPPKQRPSSRLPVVGAWQSPPPKAVPRVEEAAAEATEATEGAAEDEVAEPPRPDAPTAERLLMQRSEAIALSQIFARNADDSQSRVLLEQLAGRIALQRGQAPGSQVPDVTRNPAWFSSLIALDGQRRKRLAPTVELEAGERPDAVTAQIQAWNGVFAATAAHAFGVNAQSRAIAWREALHWWNLALGQPLEPLELPQGFDPDPPAPDAPSFYPMVRGSDRSLGSLSPALVRQWQKLARWEFNKAAYQPPMTLAWQGPHGEQNTVSMYPVDAALPDLPTPIPGNLYPQFNSFRWRLIQRTIELIDSGTRTDLGWGADQIEVRLRPEPFYVEDIGAGALDWESMVKDDDISLHNGIILMWSSPTPLPDSKTGVPLPRQRFTYLENDPADPYDSIYTMKPLQRELKEKLEEIAKSDAYSKLPSSQDDIEFGLQNVRRDYFGFIKTLFGFEEARAQTKPFYLTRLHRASSTQALTQDGNSAPEWLREGLANLACLSVARGVDAQGIYPALPADLQHDHMFLIDHPQWQRNVKKATATYEPRVNLQKKTTSKVPDSIFYGPPLIKMQTTRQAQFFYQQFGRGAVVETLQRLGSGQNIDQALYATTGLDQKEFMVRWQQWENTPQAKASAEDEELDESAMSTVPLSEATEAVAVPAETRH